jgi:hypothetical protein
MGFRQGIQVGERMINTSLMFDLFLCLAPISFDFFSRHGQCSLTKSLFVHVAKATEIQVPLGSQT